MVNSTIQSGIKIMSAISLCSLIGISTADALQIKPLKDNQTAFVTISSSEQSRLFVQGDRIRAVRGLEGAYDLKKDEEAGDIYIQPAPLYQHQAFNLFIATEQGHAYTVLASPLAIPAETIELKPLSPSILKAEQWETASPYAETLIHLIRSMVTATHPAGYAVIPMGCRKKMALSKGLTLQLRVIYRGKHLQGEVVSIQNTSKNTVLLTPTNVYQPNLLAVGWEKNSLQPNEVIRLYRVVAHD